MVRLKPVLMYLLGAIICPVLTAAENETADIIFFNTSVWTADVNKPTAEAVAVKGERIARVGSNSEVLKLQGDSTTLVDLSGKMVVPGFIDGHTHFENATEWFFEALLMHVDSQELMLERLQEAVDRVPPGMWITGGDWGEMVARKERLKGNDSFVAFTPTLADIDAVSPQHPVLFKRHDGHYFANSQALKLLRITRFTPDPSGGRYDRDADTGELTGMLWYRAGDRAFRALPPPSMAKTLIAARALVHELNSYGITGIHDISRIDEVSQQKLYHAHVERSASDIRIFKQLREAGALTVRVHALLTLQSWDRLGDFGITPDSGDALLGYGGLKSFIDGSLMFEPYSRNPDYSGNFTFRVFSPERMRDNFIGADALGFDMATHQIGDKATSLYLDWMEDAERINGTRERRMRLIHLEYPRLDDIKRAGASKAFADLTPIHMIHDMHEVADKFGSQVSERAFPGRTLIQNGMRINLVSDWPGSYYKDNEKPLNPLMNIFLAVERREPHEPPEAAWHRNESITVEEGLIAYTINPATAAREEKIKGSLTEGKLADLVVLSRNILAEPVEALLQTSVEMTMFNGDIVYRSGDEYKHAAKSAEIAASEMSNGSN